VKDNVLDAEYCDAFEKMNKMVEVEKNEQNDRSWENYQNRNFKKWYFHHLTHI